MSWSNRSYPYEFNASIDFWLKTISHVDVIAPSTVSTTQNAKLLTSPNLGHSLMLCQVRRSQGMGECETLRRPTSISRASCRKWISAIHLNDLQTRLCQYTGIPLDRPLEPQVHWDATGTTLADASTQWCSSGYPVLICIIGTHWKTTGARSTLGCHCNHTGRYSHPVVSQWRSSVNLHNWNTLEDLWKATGVPLEDHWKHTGISPVAFQCTLGSKFQAHWIATGLPLEDQWLRVRVVVKRGHKRGNSSIRMLKSMVSLVWLPSAW